MVASYSSSLPFHLYDYVDLGDDYYVCDDVWPVFSRYSQSRFSDYILFFTGPVSRHFLPKYNINSSVLDYANNSTQVFPLSFQISNPLCYSFS